jgi:hypothetical protein
MASAVVVTLSVPTPFEEDKVVDMKVLYHFLSAVLSGHISAVGSEMAYSIALKEWNPSQSVMDLVKAKLDPSIYDLLGKSMKETKAVKITPMFAWPEVITSDKFLQLYEFFVLEVIPRGLPGAYNKLGTKVATLRFEVVAYSCMTPGYQYVQSVVVYMTKSFEFGARNVVHHGN